MNKKRIWGGDEPGERARFREALVTKASRGRFALLSVWPFAAVDNYGLCWLLAPSRVLRQLGVALSGMRRDLLG